MLKLFDMSRYLRHTLLKEIGIDGQKKLLKSKVLVVGGGGLGSPILLYLAAAGIGKIGLVEYDVVDISNLQRQILYNSNQIGEFKGICARQKITELNPDVMVETYITKIDENNALDIIKEYDLVLSAVDNARTRYTINKACVNSNVFLIDGAIHEFAGQIICVFPGKTACYQCIYPESKTEANKNQITGTIGTLPGIIGTLQANEAIKYILKLGNPLKDQLLCYDALSLSIRKIGVKKNPNCGICGEKQKALNKK